MKPVEFKGVNVVFAKNQPEYRPLPAFRAPDGTVLTCWELTDEEAAEVLATGRIWLSQLTFGQPLQPQLPSATRPDWIVTCGPEKPDAI